MASINLRVPENTKDRVDRYAERRGISRTAALNVLITSALDDAERDEARNSTGAVR